VVLSVLLVPPFGLAGATAATVVALISANVATLYFVRRRLGFWPYDGRYAKPLLAGLAAAAAIYAARTILPGYTGLAALLIFAPLALIVFFVLLYALGLCPSDRRFLESFGDAARRATARRGDD
jgi:O-antigen/teichoic acid export membrane protein